MLRSGAALAAPAAPAPPALAIVHTTGHVPILPSRATVVRTVADNATKKEEETKERIQKTRALVSINLDELCSQI